MLPYAAVIKNSVRLREVDFPSLDSKKVARSQPSPPPYTLLILHRSQRPAMKPATEERRKSSRLAGKTPDASPQPHSDTLGSPTFKLPGSTPIRRRPPQNNKSFGSPKDSRGESASTLSRKRGRARSLAFASPPPSAGGVQTVEEDSPLHHASAPKTPAEAGRHRGAGVARSLCMDVAITPLPLPQGPHSTFTVASAVPEPESPTPMPRATFTELLSSPAIAGPSPKIRQWGHRVPCSLEARLQALETESDLSAPRGSPSATSSGGNPRLPRNLSLSAGLAEDIPKKQPLQEWSPVRVMQSLPSDALEDSTEGGGSGGAGGGDWPASDLATITAGGGGWGGKEGLVSVPFRVLVPRNDSCPLLAPPATLVGADVAAEDKENIHRQEIEKENVPRLDGPMLLSSPSSLDLGRRPEWADPVYRGMLFVGCEHQYTPEHYLRYLARQQKRGVDPQIDVGMEIEGVM